MAKKQACLNEQQLEVLYELLTLYFEVLNSVKVGPVNSSHNMTKIEPALEASLLRIRIRNEIDSLIQLRK